MNGLEVVERLFSLIEAGDQASAKELLADDFTFSGPVAEPISGPEWLGMHEKVHTAFPDWSFNMAAFKAEGDLISGTVQITGTHEGVLVFSNMDLPSIPATGKRIELPREEAELKVVGGKVKYFKTNPSPETGVSGILKQLGVSVPDQTRA